MNVRLPSDSLPTSPVSQAEAVRPDQAAARDTRPDAAPSAPPAPSDRVEFSAEARARAAEASSANAPTLEIEVARVALKAGSKLSDARLHELRERVRTGYYDNPTAIDRIGEAVARDLTGSDATS